MALNKIPCEKCQHYDAIIFGNGTKKTRHGWCSVRSVYPFKEQPGQVFPHGVKRAAPGELAQPYIVVGCQAEPSCVQIRLK